jgi:hypothetical protein
VKGAVVRLKMVRRGFYRPVIVISPFFQEKVAVVD